MCAEQSPSESPHQLGVLISGLWSTEETGDRGLIALKTYLARYGWTQSTAVWLLGPASSSQLLLTVVPYRSPYTKGKTELEAMRLPLKNLLKCLQRFEIAASDDLLALTWAECILEPGIAS